MSALGISLYEVPENLVSKTVELLVLAGLEHDIKCAIAPEEVVLYFSCGIVFNTEKTNALVKCFDCLG